MPQSDGVNCRFRELLKTVVKIMNIPVGLRRLRMLKHPSVLAAVKNSEYQLVMFAEHQEGEFDRADVEAKRKISAAARQRPFLP